MLETNREGPGGINPTCCRIELNLDSTGEVTNKKDSPTVEHHVFCPDSKSGTFSSGCELFQLPELFYDAAVLPISEDFIVFVGGRTLDGPIERNYLL